MKAGTGTDAIFTSGVHSPLEDGRRSIAVTFFSVPPQTNENRLNHGQNLKIINLRDQASHDSGNVPFTKTKHMPIMLAVLLFPREARRAEGLPSVARFINLSRGDRARIAKGGQISICPYIFRWCPHSCLATKPNRDR